MSLAVGLMSGTSIDGIDVALVEINQKVRLIAWEITPFPKGMKEKILAVSHPVQGKGPEICRLNFELGELFAKSVVKICRKAKVPLSKIDVIGSHGQTICHLGQEGTLQIGEPSIIAERTGVTTVADFRPRDIAAGGFGAPLAPFFHYRMFKSEAANRAVHNLGGISNLTYIPKKATLDQVIGFDTGPANMLIDGVLGETTNNRVIYDHGGKIAFRGTVSLRLLRELMQHPFIYRKPPKTAGREEFGRDFAKKTLKRAWKMGLRHEDIVATVTAFTAVSVAENYRRFVAKKAMPDEIIFGGGGIHNRVLMNMIRAELPGVKISTFDDYGVPADAAEAVCFALLAYETLQGRPTNLPSVTGARRSVVLGKIVPGGSA